MQKREQARVHIIKSIQTYTYMLYGCLSRREKPYEIQVYGEDLLRVFRCRR